MSRPEPFRFRLYVAGDSGNSAQALENLQALCREHLPERHDIQVVDVLREPGRALTDAVLLTPTLVKLSPVPVRSIVGTLARTDRVLAALGLSLPEK